MGASGLIYKVQLLANLSILVWVSILSTLGKAVRSTLLRLLLRVDPGVRAETGLLVNTYEVMRERLRDSLQEIEDKGRELEESKEQLRKSRDLLQTTIDSLDEELIVLDRQRRITQVNRSVRLKYGDQDVVGRYCYEVTHGSSHPCHPPSCVCPLGKVLQTGAPARVFHLHGPSQAGSSKATYVEVSASPLYDAGGRVTQVVELVRDITESKEQENRLLEANRYLLALNAIASAVSQWLDLDVILKSALDKTLELTKAEVGGILLPDEKTRTLAYRVYRGLSEQFVRGIAGIAVGEGVAGWVAEHGETLVVEDISRDPRVARPVVSEEGLKAFLSVPLTCKDKVVGVLNIASREPRLFSVQEVQVLTALGHQLGVAIENARLYQELQLKEQARSELLSRLISAQEDERRRVARELHDVTGQALAALAVRLEALTAAGSSPEDVENHKEGMRSLLGVTSKDLHRLIYDLRPSLLDDLGLPAALRSCAHSSLDAAGVEVHFEVAGEERRLPPQVEIALFRIVQEAITNVARHARAESTYICLEFRERSIAVQVEDDGIGFDLSRAFDPAEARESIGLLGMRERAELLGGTLTIDTKSGGGTRVAMEIPVDWG
ncbi:MAG: GAF domain-containing protein [Chloroflexi bacterium]|nr:GAF domain-containing protein [Chloroflexota bacterium]